MISSTPALFALSLLAISQAVSAQTVTSPPGRHRHPKIRRVVRRELDERLLPITATTTVVVPMTATETIWVDATGQVVLGDDEDGDGDVTSTWTSVSSQSTGGLSSSVESATVTASSSTSDSSSLSSSTVTDPSSSYATDSYTEEVTSTSSFFTSSTELPSSSATSEYLSSSSLISSSSVVSSTDSSSSTDIYPTVSSSAGASSYTESYSDSTESLSTEPSSISASTQSSSSSGSFSTELATSTEESSSAPTSTVNSTAVPESASSTESQTLSESTSPSESVSASGTESVSMSESGSSTLTDSISFSATSTVSPTFSETANATAVSETASSTYSASESSATLSETASSSADLNASETGSLSASTTVSETQSSSFIQSSSSGASETQSFTMSESASASSTSAFATATNSSSPTASASESGSATPSASASMSVSTSGRSSSVSSSSSTSLAASSATHSASHSASSSESLSSTITASASASTTHSSSTSANVTSTATSTSSAASSTSTLSTLGSQLMLGYYPDWSSSYLSPEDVDWDRFDILDFAFAIPDSDGSLYFTEDDSEEMLTRLVTAAHTAGKRVKLSIGGWTGSTYFSTLCASDTLRATFVSNIYDMYSSYDLNGIDIDWEYPGTDGADGNVVSTSDSANFLVFLQDMRDALPSDAIITTATQVWPFADTDGEPMTDVSAFADVIDWILIMNYDVWGSSTTPGPNAPLSDACGNSTQPLANAYAAVSSWTTAGMPADQITLGVPAYGYLQLSTASSLIQRRSALPQPPHKRASKNKRDDDITVTNEDGGTSDGEIMWYSLVSQGALTLEDGSYVGDGGFTRYWDSCSHTPWLKSTSSGQIITYDDPESMSLKAQFALQAGLRGCNVFSVDGDYTDSSWPLTDAVRSGLGLD